MFSKKIPSLLLISLIAAPVAEASLRVSYGAYIPTDSDYSTEYGPTAGLGFFAFNNLLQIEAEVSYLKRSRSETFDLFGFDVDVSGREKLIPILLNANLHFPI